MLITEFGDGYRISINLLSSAQFPLKVIRVVLLFIVSVNLLYLFKILANGLAGWLVSLAIVVLLLSIVVLLSLIINRRTYIMITPDYMFVRKQFAQTNELSIALANIESPVGVYTKQKVVDEHAKEQIYFYVHQKNNEKATVLYWVEYEIDSPNIPIVINFFEMVASRISKFYEIEHYKTERKLLSAKSQEFLNKNELEEDKVIDKPWRIKFDED